MEAVGYVFNLIIGNLKTLFSRPINIVDIAIVTYLIYIAIKFIRETRAAQLLKGILFLLVFMWAADFLEMSVTSFILKSTLQFGVLALLIVFQPELRSVLEQVGRRGLGNFSGLLSEERRFEDDMRATLDAVISAVTIMSATKTGAIIVMERETKLGEIIKTGVTLDAAVTDALILNVFYPKSPLHDGASVIRNNRLFSAGCVLPLTQNVEMAKEHGTRHLAAIGVSEISDAVVIIVSEETGIISLAAGGTLKRRLTPDVLNTTLASYFINPEENKESKFPKFWKGKGRNTE